MASIVQIKNVASVQAEKKMWTVPALQTIMLQAAQGSKAGSKCDKFGSLSTGTGCN
jgi:hypothetical protein